MEAECIRSESDTNNDIFCGFNRRKAGVGGRKLALEVPSEDRMAFRLMLEASQGHGTPSVRDWLQSRFSSTELIKAGQAAKDKPGTMRKVITPDSIPEFVIPGMSKRFHMSSTLPSLTSEPSLVTKCKESKLYVSKSLSEAELNNNRLRRENAIDEGEEESDNYHKPCIKSHSLESDPDQDSTGGIEINLDRMQDYDETANDPGYAAAVSIPHFRMQTSYGFAMVRESPNTRRKESLLLGSANMGDLKQFGRKISHQRSVANSNIYNPIGNNSLMVPSAHPLNASMMSLISENSSVISESPPPARCTAAESRRLYHRRRSSDQTPQLSDPSTCSSDYAGIHRYLTKEEAQELAVRGEIKLSIIYNKAERTLKLSIIKAEQLAKSQMDRQSLNIQVKCCLLPNKKQKHETKTVKGTHDPHFNEDFVFHDISPSELKFQALRLRTYNRRRPHRPDLIGEAILTLEHLGLEHEEEVRMWRDLEPMSQIGRGSINVSLRFEPREDSLSITVVEAKGLPVGKLSTQPDPYVKVTIKQGDKLTLKKQTRIRKSTSHPVFKETFTFTISPKVDDLKYTSIQISVLSKERIRNDTMIGHVLLGYGSTESGELDHWNRIISNINNDIQQWHHLTS